MSIIAISFHLIKCIPNITYTNYLYTIYSNQTNFNNTITYNAHNTITDIIEFKSDLQYFIKVYNSKELVGVTNFTIKNKLLYQKHKKLLVDLQLTLAEKSKRSLRAQGLDPAMSVKLLITFNYMEKKIGYLKNRHLEKVFSKPELRDIHISPIVHKTSQRKLFEDLSSPFKTPFDITKASKKMINKSSSVNSIHHSIENQERYGDDRLMETKTLDNKKDKNSIEEQKDIELSNDNSIIDSLIGRDDVDYSSASENEEKKIAIKDIKKLNKQLSFDKVSINKKPLTNVEMKVKVIQLSTKFTIAHKAFSRKLLNALDENQKMKNCLAKYKEKYLNIIKKEHKLAQRKDIYVIKNEITTIANRKLYDVKDEGINARRLEYELAYELLKDLGVRRREEDTFEQERTEKEFFIEIFKILIDMKANIADTITPIKRDNLIYLCEKYDIPFKEVKCITRDIKEEDEEDECEKRIEEQVNSK